MASQEQSPCEWSELEGHDDHGDDETESATDETQKVKLSHSNNGTTSVFEDLSDDVSAAILSYLTLYEISQCAICSASMRAACRSNTLWRDLFRRRWNVDCLPSSSSSNCNSNSNNNVDTDNQATASAVTAVVAADFYITSYSAAHVHPHDLWISHWNCVYPALHHLSPGRCYCIRPKRDDATATATTSAAAATTTTTTPSKSQRAFANAATFHRRLRLEQYEQQHQQTSMASTNFCSDLLFFNLTDPTTTEGQWELDQLLRESVGDLADTTAPSRASVWFSPPSSETASDNATSEWETSHHSWHICRLHNPDFVRPILFHIGVMRSDCFSVYPSEGWIGPGQSCYVTFGIRTLGSALTYSFEGLNLFREGLDRDWSDLYAEEAHLPMAPFVVRYHYGVAHPSVERNRSTSALLGSAPTPPRTLEQSFSINQTRLSTKRLLYYYKQRAVAPHQIRSIYLSAHVNAHYHFSDFAEATCHPWCIASDAHGPMISSPTLREEHPALYHRLQNGIMCTCHGEPCVLNANNSCQECWQRRSGEVRQAYAVARDQWSLHRKQRATLFRNVARCVTLLTSQEGLGGTSTNLASMLQVVCCILQSWRGSPWITEQRRRTLRRLELIVDQAYTQIPVGGADWIPWRMSGVYQRNISTSFVFGPHATTLEHDRRLLHSLVNWKAEPEHLDMFRHLAHNPGAYCLGPQEDPNHLDDASVPVTSRYFRCKVGCVTDIYRDNIATALQAGFCMIEDPRSLLVHGIYDMIPYPGSFTTRPKLDGAAATQEQTNGKEHDEESLVRKRIAYSWIQGRLDTCGLTPRVSRCRTPDLEYVVSTPFSLHMYLHGNPSANAIGDLCYGFLPENQCFQRELGAMFNVEVKDRRSTFQDDDDEEHHAIAQIPGRRRLLQRFWDMGTRLGLVVSDHHNAPAIYVDRNILIVLQWFSLFCITAPLCLSLLARYCHWIPTEPLEYSLIDLPFSVSNRLRYLSVDECGLVAVLASCISLAMARWAERHTSRDYFRVMLESMPEKKGFYARLIMRYQRKWDSVCPLFLQRRIFSPIWNRRSYSDLLKRIANCRRSAQLTEYPYLKASSIDLDEHAVFGDSRDEGLDTGDSSLIGKVTAAIIVSLGSFCSITPHVWLNAVTVLFCGIGLGMSMSIASLERGSSSFGAAVNVWPDSYNLSTFIAAGCLVGQLTGSSGGILFLAEFVFTLASLFLGGAATMSFGSRESWGCLCLLSTAAFFGFTLGRVAVMGGACHRRRFYASYLLSRIVLLALLFWTPLVVFIEWESPVSVMISRPKPSISHQLPQRSQIAIARKLQ